MPPTEDKLLEKIRALLLADSTIAGYVGANIYASHISSIEEPKYPAISLHLTDSRAVFANSEMYEIIIQIDIWMSSAKYNQTHLFALRNRINAVLNRQRLIDSALDLKVGQSVEFNTGPIMFEEDTDLLHYPLQYNFVAS